MRNKKSKKNAAKRQDCFPCCKYSILQKADWVLIGTYYAHSLSFSRYSLSFLYSSI